MDADKALYAGLPKAFLYVRVGFEGDPSSVKQLPRYRLDKDTIDRIFRCDTAFLQETRSGSVVMPLAWKDECLPAPALYVIRETVQVKLDPDALEEEAFRGSVAVFCVDVPEDVDEAGVEVWLAAGLEDDDPELVSGTVRAEELRARRKEVVQQISDVPGSAVAGASVEEETRIKDERMSKLRAQRDELDDELAALEALLRSLHAERSRGAEGRGFSVWLVETVLPQRLNTWEVRFTDSDRGRRLAYVATHKLNWSEFVLAMPKHGVGRPEARKGGFERLDSRLKLVTMRGVRVLRLQHGKGMYKFDDERGFYSGQWRAGKRHGLGVQINAQGRFSGRLVREWRRGMGTQVFANGDMYRGSFGTPAFHDRMSLLHGDEYADGLPHGNGHLRFVDGAEYSGNFAAGRPCGKGAFIDASGSEMQGTFGPLGMLDGTGSTAVGDVQRSGMWREGVLHGRAIRVDRALGKHVGMFAQGLEHGFGEMHSTACDSRYRGYHLYGVRHGRGQLNMGNVDRDKLRRDAKLRRMQAAASGKSGAARARAADAERRRSAAELGIASASLDAEQALAHRDGPISEALTGNPGGARLAASAGLGALEHEARAAAAKADRLGFSKDADNQESEYEKFKNSGNIAYPGDVMYEGCWRAQGQRFGGAITFRQGDPAPHTHRRQASTNLRQTALRGIRALAQKEETTAAARSRSLVANQKRNLARRLEQEAENLKSFAYWQQLAQKRLVTYKKRTAEAKSELQRIKRQLARPDEELLGVRVRQEDDVHAYEEARDGEVDRDDWDEPAPEGQAYRDDMEDLRGSEAIEGPRAASASSRRGASDRVRVRE